MKVLFHARPNLFSSFGGDSVQLLKTKEYLEKLGVSVDISTEIIPDMDRYDIIHAFNITTPQDNIICLKNAKQKNKKIALSTIYVDYTEFEKKARGGLAQILSNILSPSIIQYIKLLVKSIKNKNYNEGTKEILISGYKKTLLNIISMSDIFLPNSQSEMNRLVKDFKIVDPNYVIVPNSIDNNIFDYDSVIVKEAIKYKDCILCVGRIEGRKSQLNLVKAMKGLPYTLVIIGKAAPNQKKYFEKVKEEAGDNVIFIEHIEHNELPQYYKTARVHCLISWMETTGLVSLEAGIMNCNIVITKKGDTEEYFKDYAYYCEPDDIESIRNAIIEAYESPINDNLRKYISENYIWEKTAKKTLEAYQKLLQ